MAPAPDNSAVAAPSELAAPDGEADHARLKLVEITKAYPGVVANDRVNLEVAPGQIHGLIGENGAGKSTLMKIAYGLVKPDAGEIIWEGQPVSLSSPGDARSLGIGMVFQHFSLFESLTVADNAALMLRGQASDAALTERIEQFGERYGLPIDPNRYVHDLSVGERQRVEIIRCLLFEPRLLILDEPTSVLTPQASEALFATLRQLAREGTSILYISHKLHEVQALCSVATVLRGGKAVARCIPAEESAASLSRLMLGQPAPRLGRQPLTEAGEPRLRVENLHAKPLDPFGSPVSIDHFQLNAGEILGIAGVSGNGQNELMDLLCGERLLADDKDSERPAPLRLELMGHDVRRAGVAARQRLGMAFVPEERNGRGAVPPMDLSRNTLLTHRGGGLVQAGFVSGSRLRSLAQELIKTFGVKAPGPKVAAQSLSGGNLQKFIVGREIIKKPLVMLVAQPTWGVDVGAAAMIRQALLDLRSSGAAVLVVSEDLDELFEVCDVLQVIAQGKLSERIPIEQADVSLLGRLMGGLGLAESGATAS
ncbi:MAG: ABC transporter ATP-binding protein [Burkholderiaceae bacterium]